MVFSKQEKAFFIWTLTLWKFRIPLWLSGVLTPVVPRLSCQGSGGRAKMRPLSSSCLCPSGLNVEPSSTGLTKGWVTSGHVVGIEVRFSQGVAAAWSARPPECFFVFVAFYAFSLETEVKSLRKHPFFCQPWFSCFALHKKNKKHLRYPVLTANANLRPIYIVQWKVWDWFQLWGEQSSCRHCYRHWLSFTPIRPTVSFSRERFYTGNKPQHIVFSPKQPLGLMLIKRFPFEDKWSLNLSRLQQESQAGARLMWWRLPQNWDHFEFDNPDALQLIQSLIPQVFPELWAPQP